MLAGAALMIGAASLGGCGASLGNFLPTTSASASPMFMPTSAASSDASSSVALSQAAEKFTAAATPGNNAYKIGPADVLDISVFKVPDLSKTVQVADDGTINFPLIGEVPAGGKTAHQVERVLAEKLGAKYLRSPDVTVLVKEYNSQRVTIDGSVKKPGVYTLKGRTTLVQVLAMAEGVNVDLASGDVVIFRRIDGKRCAARVDVDSINNGKAEDPELQPGDVIEVDTSGTKVAFQNFLRALPLATATAMFVPLL
jgi:polysaccharide export outer membrane protein